MEREDRVRELAEKVHKATFDQLEIQIQSDLNIIRAQRPTQAAADMETLLDMKYLKARQQTLSLQRILVCFLFCGAAFTGIISYKFWWRGIDQ